MAERPERPLLGANANPPAPLVVDYKECLKARPDVMLDFDNRIARLVSAHCGAPITRIAHSRNAYASRNRSGLVTCFLGSEESVTLFWKLGSARVDVPMGRIGCVANEAMAYREVERVGSKLAPRLIGADISGADALIVTEYVVSAYRVQKSPLPGSLERAAGQIGAFHQVGRFELADSRLSRYDKDFYRHWATAASRRLPRLPGLKRIADRFPDLVVELQEGYSTVIHGELYPDNVLVSPDRVVAVDWEWSGIGLGEIDLAALIEGWWGPEVVSACERAYATARGRDLHGGLARKRLAAARLYLHLRWLGGRPSGPLRGDADWRLREIPELGIELGMLAPGRFGT